MLEGLELMAAAAEGNLTDARIALENGAEPNFVGKGGLTALMVACKAGHIEIMKLLLEKGTNPNFKGRHAPPALLLAVKGDRADLLELLLKYGADPMVRGDSNLTALESASAIGHTSCVRILLAPIAQKKEAASILASSLRLAASAGKIEVIAILLSAGARIGAQDSDGYTPLMFAALNGRHEAVTQLLMAGADLTISAVDGKTAFDCAKQQGHLKIAVMIRSKQTGLPGFLLEPYINEKINGTRLLVVDDDPDCRSILELFLKRTGFNVRTAEHGKDALEILHDFKPEVVVTDFMMPVMTGLDLCIALRKEPAGKNLKIVLLSAKGFKKRGEKARSEFSGIFDAIMEKPVSLPELLKEIKKLIGV